MEQILTTLSENYNLALDHFATLDLSTLNNHGSKMFNKYFNETSCILTNLDGKSGNINNNIIRWINDIIRSRGTVSENQMMNLYSSICAEYFTGGNLNLYYTPEIDNTGGKRYCMLVKYITEATDLRTHTYIELRGAKINNESWFKHITQLKDHYYAEHGDLPCYLVAAKDLKLVIFEFLPYWHSGNGFHKVGSSDGLMSIYWDTVTSSIKPVPQNGYLFTNVKSYDLSSENDILCVHNIFREISQKPWPSPRNGASQVETFNQASEYTRSLYFYNKPGPQERYEQIFGSNIRTPMELRMMKRTLI